MEHLYGAAHMNKPFEDANPGTGQTTKMRLQEALYQVPKLEELGGLIGHFWLTKITIWPIRAVRL